ncbi:hypothetical protein RB195_018305 [Necator americanus]|uniref:Endonuclease/exonuclease/phosphatase domain-containing protein n=1 Tax=Necator americanus TaxID=51031 RepID=A0ABR1C939_NECAM
MSHLVDSHEIWSPLSIFRLRPLRQKSMSTIYCYSPTSEADESELDTFYEGLEEEVCSDKSLYRFVVGDFNAKLEKATEEKYRIGIFGLGDRNENGNLSREFYFHEKDHHRWTWESPTIRAEANLILNKRGGD